LSVVTQKQSLKRQQSEEAKNKKYLAWYLIFINVFNLYLFA
jgi:succinate-acetate transporter protein